MCSKFGNYSLCGSSYIQLLVGITWGSSFKKYRFGDSTLDLSHRNLGIYLLCLHLNGMLKLIPCHVWNLKWDFMARLPLPSFQFFFFFLMPPQYNVYLYLKGSQSSFFSCPPSVSQTCVYKIPKIFGCHATCTSNSTWPKLNSSILIFCLIQVSFTRTSTSVLVPSLVTLFVS